MLFDIDIKKKERQHRESVSDNPLGWVGTNDILPLPAYLCVCALDDDGMKGRTGSSGRRHPSDDFICFH